MAAAALPFSDLIAIWEAARHEVRATCRAERDRLMKLGNEAMDRVSLQDLMQANVDDLTAFETTLNSELALVDHRLAHGLALDVGDPVPTATTGIGPGWGWQEAAAIVGGSVPGAAIFAGTKAAPAAAAAIGLGVLALPLTVAAAAGGLGWSAWSMTEGRRAHFRRELSACIDRALCSEDYDQSLVKRQDRRLDAWLDELEQQS